ncbi:NAD(P)/FAD-dependent oxidoreductase [Pseudonocardia sp.]|uniref:NAD(P)/FAD-dependent oxidoreductase n=1 Tax=Pseudonocardia sp. TaxID=60912 RepID=UPI003D0CD3A1
MDGNSNGADAHNAFLDCDLLIVGAGPVGLFAAYYAGFRGLKVAVVDALAEPGGQISAMYPEKLIFDIAGFPSVKGRDLVDGLLEQATRFDTRFLLGDRAQLLRPVALPGGRSEFEVVTANGASVRCGAVVVTAGIGAFAPRKLGAGDEFEGRGLAYFVPDPSEYANQDVVVVGGGDSAVDWALTLHPIARSVTLVHRRRTFRAHEASLVDLRATSVEIITDAQVAGVFGGPDVERVALTGPGVEDGRELPCRRLVAALGFVADLGPLRSWGLEIAHHRHLVVDSAMQTSVPGIFAAGDITEYPGKVRLIAVGFGEAATAVNNAAVFLNPEVELFPGHSTDAGPAAPAQSEMV